MVDLLPAEFQALVATLSPTERDEVLALCSQALSANTRKAYFSHWGTFVQWCRRNDRLERPADAGTLLAYVAYRSKCRRAFKTIRADLTAIAWYHLAAGHPLPPRELLELALRAAEKVAPPEMPKLPLRRDELGLICQLIEECETPLAAARNRALILSDEAAALRSAEVTALHMEHIRFRERGMEVWIAKSKTDQAGRGALVFVQRRHELCPVSAMQRWMSKLGRESGPLFVRFHSNGSPSQHALNRQYVRTLLQKYIDRIGLDRRLYGSHSLRAQWATEAFERGEDVMRMLLQMRQKSPHSLMPYIKYANPWSENTTRELGL